MARHNASPHHFDLCGVTNIERPYPVSSVFSIIRKMRW